MRRLALAAAAGASEPGSIRQRCGLRIHYTFVEPPSADHVTAEGRGSAAHRWPNRARLPPPPPGRLHGREDGRSLLSDRPQRPQPNGIARLAQRTGAQPAHPGCLAHRRVPGGRRALLEAPALRPSAGTVGALVLRLRTGVPAACGEFAGLPRRSRPHQHLQTTIHIYQRRGPGTLPQRCDTPRRHDAEQPRTRRSCGSTMGWSASACFR